MRPIGMLDSGVGGLSVLRELRALLPAEAVIYVADQGHLPYGQRQRDEIRSYVEGIAHFLSEQGCKLLIIACNAANAAALHYLREILPDMPIVGMEPAVKPAAEHTRSGVIGVITTRATYQSELFASVMDRFARDVRVETQVCPEFVLLAEQGAPDMPESRAVVARYLAPLKAAGIDQLVLGCTHFPFLRSQLAAYLGPGVDIIDPAPAVARQARRVLEQHGLLAEDGRNDAPVSYVTTGDPGRFGEVLAALTGQGSDAIYAGCWEDGALHATLDGGWMSTILHITSRAAWEQAQSKGAYRTESLEGEGFIHLSKPDQVIRVANALYRDQPGLVLLHVDPARLKADLRYEAPVHPGASDTSERFPHLYGPLNLDAVTKVTDLKPGADGLYPPIDPASL